MTELYPWLAAVALAAAGWLAALKLALLRVSRSSIARMGAEGAEWLTARFDAAMFTISLLRTTARIAFFVLVLAEVVDLGAEASLTWSNVAIACAVSVPLLWIFTSVLAAALARHAGAGLISTGMPVLRALMWLCYPLTGTVSFIDEVVRRLSGAAPEANEMEAELLRSIEETKREGGLDKQAADMLENVVEFASTDAAQIMTPRTDVQGIELTDDLAEIRAFIGEVGHSRIPVYRDNLDNIVGILYVRDLVPYLGSDAEHFRLEPLLRQPIFVPETKPVRDLLAVFRKGEVHLAIVIDEYGGTEGLVTIEDVLEEIVGEIRDEHEPDAGEVPSLVEIDQHVTEVDGRYHIDDLNERLGLALPEDNDYDTIGGFVMAKLGHVPDAGETFESHDARFTAVVTAPTHVQKVRIELLKPPAITGQVAVEAARDGETK